MGKSPPFRYHFQWTAPEPSDYPEVAAFNAAAKECREEGRHRYDDLTASVATCQRCGVVRTIVVTPRRRFRRRTS